MKPPITMSGPFRKTRRRSRWRVALRRLYADVLRFLAQPSPFR